MVRGVSTWLTSPELTTRRLAKRSITRVLGFRLDACLFRTWSKRDPSPAKPPPPVRFRPAIETITEVYCGPVRTAMPPAQFNTHWPSSVLSFFGFICGTDDEEFGNFRVTLLLCVVNTANPKCVRFRDDCFYSS